MKSDLSKAKKAFAFLLAECPASTQGSAAAQMLQGESAETRNEEFNRAFDVWVHRLWPSRVGLPHSDRRIGDINWKTFYNKGLKCRKANRAQNSP